MVAESQAWSTPVPLASRMDSDRGAHWSPVLAGPPIVSERLLLFYTESSRLECIRPAEGKHPELWSPGGTIKMVEALGHGTGGWSEPRVVLSEVDSEGVMIPKVIANPPVRNTAGALVLPFWREKSTLPEACQAAAAEEYAGVLISEDEGGTWTPHGRLSLPGSHLIEGTIALGPYPGHLLMLFRTGKGWAYKSVSNDDGRTWSAPQPTPVKNPDTKMHMMGILAPRRPLGGILLAANDHRSFAEAGCRKCRTRLMIAHSLDSEGKAWRRLAPLELPRKPLDYLKNHYPTMLQVACRLYVVYSRSYSCCAPADAKLGIRLVFLSFK